MGDIDVLAVNAREATWKRCADLVAWYEQFKPAAGQRIAAPLSPADLWKCVHPNLEPPGKKFPREVVYRGRTLVASKP